MHAELLSPRIALKHRRQRDVQGFADGEEARRADAVHAVFIFLNLLKRDAQFLPKPVLAQLEREPALAHPSADIRVDGGCASSCDLFGLCFSHRFDLPRQSSDALCVRAPLLLIT